MDDADAGAGANPGGPGGDHGFQRGEVLDAAGRVLAAVDRVRRALQRVAAEVAQFGIRVVEVMPGPIETDMLATSDRPAAAIDHADYRALAERMWETRQGVRASYTPASEAARRIVDAICDDDGPLRYGCDDMSEGMLSGWNASDNADWTDTMLQSMS